RVRRRLRDVRHGAGGRLRQAEGPGRVGAERRGHRRARPPGHARRLVFAVRRQVLRDLRRLARGPRQDRGPEPPQRQPRPQVDAEARDHRRRRAEGAHHLLAVRSLRLRRAVGRRRRRHHHAPRARQELPQGLHPGARHRDRALAEPPGGSELRLPALEGDRDGRQAGLRAGGHHEPEEADPRRPGARLLHPDRAARLRGPRVLREGLRQGAHRERRLRARRRAAGQHRRWAQDLRPPHRRHRRAYDLRELQAAPGQGREAPGEEPDGRAQPQHRRRAAGVRHLHRGDAVSARPGRAPAAGLAGIVALAIVLRVAHILALRSTPWFDHLVVDPQFYDEWASRLAAGDWLGERPFYMDPLYPYVLGVLYRIAGRDLLLARLLNVAFSAGACVCVAQLGRRVGGWWVGLLAALGFALYRPDIFSAAEIDKTSLSVFLTAAALALAAGRAHLGAGVTLGLAALTRANYLLLAPLVALAFLRDPDERGVRAAAIF